MSTAAVPRIAPRTAALTALVAVVASAAATALVALAATALGDAAGFAPLNPPVFLAFAIAGTLAGIAGWALVVRVVRRPARLLRVLVPSLVVLSWIPDVILLATGFIPGATPVGVAALMLMHPLVATAAVIAGRRIAPAAG